MIDPPIKALISVPEDSSECVRPEVCFGQRPDAESFTRACLPARKRANGRGAKLRFAVGERVACLVEDDSDYTVWKAGTVAEEWTHVPASEGEEEGVGDRTAMYTVQLDSGCRVLVHRDDHLLIRDLKYQAEGAHRACGKRFKKRRRDGDGGGGDGSGGGSGEWEVVDHSTRRTRPCSPPADDEQ